MLYLTAILFILLVPVLFINVVVLKATVVAFKKGGLTWRIAVIVTLIAMSFGICFSIIGFLNSASVVVTAIQLLCVLGMFVLPIMLIRRFLQIKPFVSVAIIVVATIVSGIVGVGYAFGLRAYIYQSFRIPSASMAPTLSVGDHIFVNKLAYLFGTPCRGEVVVYKYPVDTSKSFIHRVIAVGGDMVELRDKKVFINGNPYENDPGVDSSPEGKHAKMPRFGPIAVPADSFFVLGDNRNHSYDSRFWGFVKLGQIVGRPSIIYWSYDSKRERIRTERIGARIGQTN